MQDSDLNKVILEQNFFLMCLNILLFIASPNTPPSPSLPPYLRQRQREGREAKGKLRERLDKRTGNIYKTWHFSTLSSPLFTYYYDLFYKDLGTGYKKIIPDNIFKLLTPVSLCYWIMIDGYKKNKGVGLATNSFTFSNNQKLVKALNTKFGFSSWIVDDQGSPSIYIPKSDSKITTINQGYYPTHLTL